ncbi:malate dehydrogenase (oxaloacetate-decarboxylating)(NADP+) [Exophiala aquamarina CBS 119918]|uniref:Malic enzyme n=1 Tax=Exophiala aquamarina CBS 119918 TaxID=1182545 RepID=A0A072PVE6_9EURO|nr:malate dehydrogenase (oxaloacetate-decarboxylating)(NADP+) [Exophiala aquamarina CBS 119918]KEF63712.1 malate dehydrogenase (oxaloacetate-decarboxylating)(NADP+) [Exophiala aquamarina CBS 119918]
MTTSSATQAPIAQHTANLGSIASHGPQSPLHHRPKHTHATAHVPNRSAHYDTSLSIPARKYLQTYGLTPPRAESYEVQKKRCLAQLALKSTDIERFLYLSTLRYNNVHLFYRLLTDHFTELTPLVYTPTVGEACQRWSEIYQQPEGMYLSFEDRGHLANIIQNWPQSNVEITVVTDGSRILGLGDLGVGGMGIPIGKLALYTGCAGIRPEGTLPLTVDLGTGNKTLLEDPLYMGSRRGKVTAEEEKEFLDELMAALKERWPDIVIQFEDWKNPFPSLERYRHDYAMFNDDIQGTGAVIMGGIIGAVKQSGVDPKDHRAVFLGSGSAGVGVAKQIVDYFMHEGLTEEQAKNCFWLVDSKGLVTSDRGDTLAEHKIYFSRTDNDGQQFKTLDKVIEYVKPTIIMGLSTIGGAFTPEILQKMGKWNNRPIIFPLSNPSSKSECTFEEAISNTDGRALFASGSPFHPVTYNGKMYHPGQGNNMYVFPGIGLGTILSKSVQVTSNMIYASGEALPTMITEEEKDLALLYPAITRIRDVSARVALYVIRAAQKDNVDRLHSLRDMDDATLEAWIKDKMYDPHKETEEIESELRDIVQDLGMSSPRL